MEFYKMLWGDVLRMNTDFRFPPNSIEHIEFAPQKEKYKQFGNPAMLRTAFINSFRASSKKFSCRKWVLDELSNLPAYIENTKQKKTRWNIDFIKVEEEEKEETIINHDDLSNLAYDESPQYFLEEVVEEVVEELEEVEEQEELEINEEKGVRLWQQ